MLIYWNRNCSAELTKATGPSKGKLPALTSIVIIVACSLQWIPIFILFFFLKSNYQLGYKKFSQARLNQLTIPQK